MPGYVFLFRDIANHWVWKDGRMAHRWMDLLIQAQWENKTVYFDGERVDLKRGQFITTTRLLMGRWRTNPRIVLKSLEIFEKDKMIRCKKTTEMTIITICNYDAYQSKFGEQNISNQSPFSFNENDDDTERGRKRQEKRQKKRIKEDKNKEENITKTSSVVERAPTHEEVFEDFFNAQAAVEAFCMTESIDIETCKKLAQEVINDWNLSGQTHQSLSDGRRHLLNQLRIKIKVEKQKQNGTGKKAGGGNNGGGAADRYAARRGTDVGDKKASDYGDTF